MHLKSITIRGFKSFPDRTRLEFGPGTSVIVGPNGSGKSNVTDAVLWALGEQSPLAVRGQSMQDVIFAGAPGRQAARQATVELVLDDSDGALGLGSEVSILRSLDRSGEGEYRLDGARCRLVDVLEVLSDTGLGKEMHSVISQGRVEAIVTSKPRDRRLLIEEAAGLGKHRKRRRRAQLKLAHTQENLDRALDVEREARSRLRPLKRQAEAAELHARLHRQMLEIRWELGRDELRRRREELGSAEARSAAARAARAELEGELERVAARRRMAEEALAARSSQREQLSRRSYAAQAAGDRVAYRLESIKSAAAAAAARLGRARSLHAALCEQMTADVPDSGAAERIEKLERELASLELDRETELARQLAELEDERERAAGAVAERVLDVNEVAEADELARTAVDGARKSVREAERAVEAARRESARVGAELAAANQFLRSHQQAPGGARSLADGLKVAAGFELAVAAALDGRLGAALARDRREGSELLSHLGPDGGRVLLASSDEMPGRQRAAADLRAPCEGAERLADRVRGGDGVGELARELLEDVWVVEDLGAVPSDFGGVAVTVAGRVLSVRQRELRQAPAVGEERVLAERNRRDQLIAESERAVQAEQAALRALEQSVREAGELERAHDAAVAQLRQAARLRDEAVEELRRLTERIERRRDAPDEGPLAARRAQLRAEAAGLRAAYERAERDRRARLAQIAQLQEGIERDQQATAVIDGLTQTLELAIAAIAERRSEFEQALAADRQAGEHVAEELRACAREEAGLQNRLHQASETLTGLEVQAQRTRDLAEEALEALSSLAGELKLEPRAAPEPLEEQARRELDARLERLVRRREQLGPVNPLAADEYADALEHVEELERQRTDLETAMRELEKLIRDTDRQIKEMFEQTFAAAAVNFEELVAQLFPGGHGRLRLVKEAEARASVLGGQPLDVVGEDSGEADRSAHAPTSGEAGTEEVDAGAQEDLLGVEIEITPAGKTMKQLTLLSGGEKSMTALAFLFSVFLARPCPFYILDEVEAALDDLNIDRFLDLLAANSSRAQFIVVTHQKRTMEAADSLYGVSMGGDGISKVISRRLAPRAAAA